MLRVVSNVGIRFSAIDKDGDNEVSLDEFSRGCGRLGLGLSETQLQQVLYIACLPVNWFRMWCDYECIKTFSGRIFVAHSCPALYATMKLFSFMDADGGGKIDIDEFKLARQTMATSGLFFLLCSYRHRLD